MVTSRSKSGTSHILLLSCLSLPHRMTEWLPSHLSIHCLKALPHSRPCIPHASGCTFPSSSDSVSLVSSSLRMVTMSLLSSCSPLLSRTYLNTWNLNWEDWEILNDFINLFSQRWAIPTAVGSANMVTRGSNYCFLVGWSQNQAFPAQGCL